MRKITRKRNPWKTKLATLTLENCLEKRAGILSSSRRQSFCFSWYFIHVCTSGHNSLGSHIEGITVDWKCEIKLYFNPMYPHSFFLFWENDYVGLTMYQDFCRISLSLFLFYSGKENVLGLGSCQIYTTIR